MNLHNKEAWLEARRKGIGGSDAAAILGISPWRSQLDVYLEKIGDQSGAIDETEAMRWGHLLEPAVKKAYQAATGRTLLGLGDYEMVQHPEHEWLLASLDDYVEDKDKGLGIFEAKTTSAWKGADWDDKVPPYYNAQGQHYLAATGLSYISFAVLIGGQEFRWMDVERDEQFISTLIAEEEKFWKHVQDRVPPEPDGSKAAARALGIIYPDDSGETIECGEEALDWDCRRQEAILAIAELGKKVKEVEKVKILAENKIKALLGDHTYGLLPDGTSYSWKTQEREGYTVEPKKFRVLRRRKAK